MAVMHIEPLRRMVTQISIAAIGSADEIKSRTNSVTPHGSSEFGRGKVAI